MLNDVAITGQTASTDEYLKIINALKRENLIDVIGLQAHAFEFEPAATNVPSIPGHPYVPQDDMRVHKANLDRLAATGIPIDITELDLDGQAVNGVAGDEVQLGYYRNVIPTFWEHPAVRGITLWGWRAPNHWRNAQSAPIALQNGTLKPAGAWFFNYVNGIAPVIRPEQSFTIRDGYENRVGTVIADDWASAMNRTNLRTFKWRITGGSGASVFDVEPATGELRVANPQLLDDNTTYSVQLKVSDGFHESSETEVSVAVEDLASVVDGGAGASVPATLSLTLGNASFGAFTPGVEKDYEASAAANVISTAGEATLSVVDPAGSGRLVNGAFSLASPVQAAVGGPFAPVGAAPLVVHSWSGPVSNDALSVRFKQPIGSSEPLRTGSYGKTLTFTLSTTAP
jgi:hypothetical protein